MSRETSGKETRTGDLTITGLLTSGSVVNPVITGALSLPDGSASAPSLTNIGDTNTGLFYPADDTVAISTGGTERIRVDSSGNVGIGSSIPAGRLHIAGASAEYVHDRYSSDSAGVNLILRKSRGTPALPSAVQNVDYIGALLVRGYGDTGFGGANVGLAGFLAAENFTDSAQGTHFVVGTTPTGSTTRAERMRIDSAGNVGIGTSSPLARLHVVNNNEFSTGGRFVTSSTQTTQLNYPVFIIENSNPINNNGVSLRWSIANTSSTPVNAGQISVFSSSKSASYVNGNMTFLTADGSGNVNERMRIDSAGQITTGLGSSASPVLSFSGDTNTGIFSPAGDTVAISTNGSERVRVDSSGRMGVGISPTSKLHVYDASASDIALTGDGSVVVNLSRASTNNSAASIDTYKARGTLTSPTAVSSGDIIGQYQYKAYDGAAYRDPALLRVTVDGTPASDDMPGRWGFWTRPAGAAASLVERMRIDKDGLITGTGSLGAWTAYTPTLTTGVTEPVLGTGSVAAGFYCQIGKVVHFRARLKFGTSGTGFGSGSYLVSLPVTARTVTYPQPQAHVMVRDVSTGKMYIGHALVNSTTTLSLRLQSESTGTDFASSTSPFTWQNEDEIFVIGTYEAA